MIGPTHKLKLLDLFCGAGGASLGYEQAGFHVTGVDILPQKNYKGEFIQYDALQYLIKFHHLYDVIHASPPCQAYSRASAPHRKNGKTYPDLISPLRDILLITEKPYIIENVRNAPLINPFILCGSMFNIPTYRHRLFESNVPIKIPFHPKHIYKSQKYGRPKDTQNPMISYVGHFSGVEYVQQFTGLTWLTQKELAQSIPPQYTKYLGTQILKSNGIILTHVQLTIPMPKPLKLTHTSPIPDL